MIEYEYKLQLGDAVLIDILHMLIVAQRCIQMYKTKERVSV